MKNFIFSIFFFISCASICIGQKPVSTPATIGPRQKDFGWSLKKSEKKKSSISKRESGSKTPLDDEVIRVNTDLVVNDVLVTDQEANIIDGLKKDDFILVEDGKRQTIEIFSSRENAKVPRSIVLIVDWSTLGGPYLKSSFEAAKILVDKLRPDDRMAIVTADIKLRVDLTRERVLLKKTIDFLGSLDKSDPTERESWPFDTFLAVANEMFSDDGTQRIILFQGDGIGVLLLKPDKEAPYRISDSTFLNSGMRYVGNKYQRKFGYREVRDAVESSRATTYSIIPGIRFLGLSRKEQLDRAKITLTEANKFYNWNGDGDLLGFIREFQGVEVERKVAAQTAMFRLAELSGGNTGFIEKPEDAQNIYAEIFTIIENRYVLGYYPSDRTQGEKTRTIKVEVRGHPEYIVTGRKTYSTQ